MTSYGDWTTMQLLKTDIQRMKELDPQKYLEDIKQEEESLAYFKKKVCIK